MFENTQALDASSWCAEVRHGSAVAAVEQDNEYVTVELTDGQRLRSHCLVGCDGAGRFRPGCPGTPAASAGGSPNGAPQLKLIGKPILAYARVVGDAFKALADPTRRTILDELTQRDGQTLFEICARLATKHGLGSTRQAISQHLEVLESAGLVITRREGRYKFHHLDTAPLQQIAQRWPTNASKEHR